MWRASESEIEFEFESDSIIANLADFAVYSYAFHSNFIVDASSHTISPNFHP